MTNEEAIEQIQQMIYYYESLIMDDDEKKDYEAFKIAISAIRKQISKKPSPFSLTCPVCKHVVADGTVMVCPECRQIMSWDKYRYCPHCGHKISDCEEDEKNAENNTEFVLPDDSWDDVRNS